MRLACLMKPHHAKLDRPSGLRKRFIFILSMIKMIKMIQNGWAAHLWLPVNKVALGLELANPNCRARKAIRQGKGHENWSQGHPVRCIIKLTRLYQRYQRHLVVSVFLLRIWVSMEDVRQTVRGTKAFG